jgi:transcriptional regulator with XRE-family HTH domain
VRKALGNLTQQQLADALGISKSTIASIENGRSKLTYDQLVAISSQLGVHTDFLLHGQSPVLEDYATEGYVEVADSVTSMKLVVGHALASYGDGRSQIVSSFPEIVVPGIDSESTRAFEIIGDSMDPVLCDGDFVICRKLTSEDEVPAGAPCVVVSLEGVVAKYVRHLADGLRCYSANDVSFDPFMIPYSEVYELWLIKMRLTKHIENGRLESEILKKDAEIEKLQKVLDRLLSN